MDTATISLSATPNPPPKRASQQPERANQASIEKSSGGDRSDSGGRGYTHERAHKLQMLAFLRHNVKKSSKVADESMFGGTDHHAGGGADELGMLRDRRHHGWNGMSVICSIFMAPLLCVSCLSQPHANAGGDRVWVTGGGEIVQMSDINHLIVNDSMRYALLM